MKTSFLVSAVLVVALGLSASIRTFAQQPTPAANPADQIPSSALIQPADLAQLLHQPHPPLVLQVGSHVLYAEAHIPGSEYVGAAGTPEGIQALRARLSTLSKATPIVIYCGCCPWGHCPNIRPAYALLQQSGFTHAKALYIPQNFGTDWVNKGYLVEKGR